MKGTGGGGVGIVGVVQLKLLVMVLLLLLGVVPFGVGLSPGPPLCHGNEPWRGRAGRPHFFSPALFLKPLHSLKALTFYVKRQFCL